MEKAIVVGKLLPIRKIPEWRKPLKVQFGSILRRTLSANLIPVNRCGR